FFGLRQTKFGGAKRLNSERRDEFFDLAHLSGIVACNHKPVAATNSDHSFNTCFCKATNSVVPLRARRSSSANCSSLKGAPSAVPWISTIPPAPVSTKLESVSAVESSA